MRILPLGFRGGGIRILGCRGLLFFFGWMLGTGTYRDELTLHAPLRSRFRVSGFKVSGCGFRLRSFGFRVWSFGFRVWSFRLRDWSFRLRVSGSGFWVSGFGCTGTYRAKLQLHAAELRLQLRPLFEEDARTEDALFNDVRRKQFRHLLLAPAIN